MTSEMTEMSTRVGHLDRRMTALQISDHLTVRALASFPSHGCYNNFVCKYISLPGNTGEESQNTNIVSGTLLEDLFFLLVPTFIHKYLYFLHCKKKTSIFGLEDTNSIKSNSPII